MSFQFIAMMIPGGDRAQSLSNLLLETGDDFLLEDENSYLLME